jgi:hypothetical protein
MVGAVFSSVNARAARAGRRSLVWAGLAAVLALILNFVPLFNLLGYDFSFVMGLLVALASVDIGCAIVQTARRQKRKGTTGVLALIGEAIGHAVAILLLPLALSLLNGVRVQNCNVTAGLAFYLLLPVATAVYGAGAGVLAGLVFPRRGRLVAFALPVVSILWTLGRLYFDPPVFAFDPFGGYFPGPIYDEALRPSSTFLTFRICNLIWMGTAVAIAVAAARVRDDAPPTLGRDVRRWGRRPVALAVPLLIASLWLFTHQARLGFHLSRTDLTRILDGERRTARIVLRYATGTGIGETDLDLIMEDLDFRYDQLRDLFKVEPSRAITIYQFANGDEKKILVGAGNTLYAKPWTREIFVQAEQFPSRRLRHEMAHVFAGSFGDPLFGVAFRLRWKGPIPIPRLASGLIEGIAEAADFTDPDGGSTTHQEAAAIIGDGRATPLADLMGAGFSAVSGPRAYTLAGSFCRFLLETRGADKLRAIYSSAGDFPAVYGTTLAALDTEWRAFLAKQSLSAEQQARAREQFRRPAIFKKICAREQAARINDARHMLNSAPTQAVRLLEQACGDDPGEPTIRVELAQATAAAGDTKRALSLLGAIAREADVTSPVRARAAGLAAAIQFRLGDTDNARVALRDVLAAATDEGERRQATAKLRALDDEPAQRTLGRALFGTDIAGTIDPVLAFYLFSEFARLHPSEALGSYLVGRQLAARDPRLAIPPLRAACQDTVAEQALPADFRRECLRLIMMASYRAGDLPRSAAAARTLATESADLSEQLRAGDFLERIVWRQAKN